MVGLLLFALTFCQQHFVSVAKIKHPKLVTSIIYVTNRGRNRQIGKFNPFVSMQSPVVKTQQQRLGSVAAIGAGLAAMATSLPEIRAPDSCHIVVA